MINCCLTKNTRVGELDRFYLYGLTLIPAWISNHIPINVWDELIHPFPNSNSTAVEVWEWISNFITHFKIDMITYRCWHLS